MNKRFLTPLLTVLLTLVVAAAGHAISLSTGSYTTSFDCSGFVKSTTDVGDCLDFINMEGPESLCGKSTEFQSAGNNPLGTGNAMRVVVGDGKNTYTYTGGFSWNPGVPELWLRFYIKYQEGFAWSSLGYDKIIYLHTDPFYSRGPTSPIFEWYGNDGIRLWQGNSEVVDTGVGWQTTMGGPVSDGKWHALEFHLKTDTNGADGIYQAWVDGAQVADHKNVNFLQANFYWFILYSNESSPLNPGGCGEVWLDDVAIYTTKPPHVDAKGNPFIGTLDGSVAVTEPPPAVPPPTTSANPVVLFEETFEDANLSARGWYDNVTPVLTKAEAITAGGQSLEYHFLPGATAPINGGAMRKKFTASDSVYLRYYVKYSNNWVGSQRSYHPHEFMFMTNKESDWSGLAYTYFSAYVEQNALHPRFAIQDGRNIDVNNLNVNLVNVTENRSVAGCNGDSDGYGNGDCYAAGSGQYWNDKHWIIDRNITPGVWHKVEAYIKLNSISGGKGVANGIMQYWLDDQQLANYSDIMFRTGQHPDMLFSQFIIAPWIGDGSPIDQVYWVDELFLATEPPAGATVIPPMPPTNLRLIQ